MTTGYRSALSTVPYFPGAHFSPLFFPILSYFYFLRAAVASVPVPPEGGLPPSELLRACELDPATLLRLIRKGWLEVTPADSSTR